MSLITQRGFSQEAFEAFLRSRQEPDWLARRRREAWETFLQLPMPSTSQEQWRRTDLRAFHLERFAPPGGEASSTLALPEPLLSAGVELAGSLRLLNSRPVHRELNDAAAGKGVLFGPLEALAGEYPDLVREHLLTRAVNPNEDKFSALHAAWFAGGALLYVPRGVVVEQPLHVLASMAEGGSDFGHLLIVLEEGAEATLLYETRGDDTDSLHSGAIEVFVGPEARLRLVSLQNWGARTWHFAHQKALVDRGGRLQWTVGALGARLAKVDQHVVMTGRGADVQVNGVMFTEDRQHQAYHTLQHHRVPECRSDLLYKGALQDHSRLVWRGSIKVDPGAVKTDGYQRNDNLILSDHARADCIPGLEIEADDVRCTHGATAGRVDEELIFYCQTRGLTRREATRVVVLGFFQQVIDRITIESVREALAEAIGQRVRDIK